MVVNPYKKLPIYTEKVIELYNKKKCTILKDKVLYINYYGLYFVYNKIYVIKLKVQVNINIIT